MFHAKLNQPNAQSSPFKSLYNQRRLIIRFSVYYYQLRISQSFTCFIVCSLIATGISFSDVIGILLVYICMFTNVYVGLWEEARILAVECSHICYKIPTGKHLSSWFTLDQWRHRSTTTQHFCIKLALTQCKAVFVYSLLLHWNRMAQNGTTQNHISDSIRT